MGKHLGGPGLFSIALILTLFNSCKDVDATALKLKDDRASLFTSTSDHGEPLSARYLLSGGRNGTYGAAGAVGAASVLEAFRRGLSDPTGALKSWNTTTSPNVCKWAGVNCTQFGNVSALNLTGMGLAGAISPSLGSLGSLLSLDLGGNNFSGRIPRSLGSLRKLRYLILSNNSLSGSIPVDITNCSSLIQVSLSGNHFSGAIPSELGKLKNISELDLSHNALKHSIPKSLGNCSSLRLLNLGSNNLSGYIPPEIGRLRKLSNVDLTFNHLVGTIPKSLVNCSLLKSLELNDNDLTGHIMPELGTLRHLTKLHLFLNFLTGTIPRSLGNMTSLVSLQMGGYPNISLTGTIPPELGNLRKLQWLVIYKTNITGTIPPELSNITSPMFILLFWNKLTGTIPEVLGNVHSLIGFNVDYNQLEGRMPASLGNLKHMGWLGLKWNRFTGGIPSSFQNMTRLWRLRLNNNMLSGSLIPELGNLTAIEQLSLDSNEFTGEVPATFAKLVNLKTLNLSDNKLSGAIPPAFFSAMGNAATVQLDNNNFSGTIPPSVGNMLLLQLLDLSHNSFSGKIPRTIKGCKNLNTLILSNNQLTGELPVVALESLNLTVFSVANNSLEGPVPSSVGNFAKFNSSAYKGNPGLCGPVVGVNCTNTTSSNKERSCSGISPRCRRGMFYGVIIVGSLVTLPGVLMLVGCLCHRMWKPSRVEAAVPRIVQETDSYRAEEKGHEASVFTKEFKKMLTLEELRSATDGFCTANTLGEGGQSIVFKAVLPDSGGSYRVIAVKLLDANVGKATLSQQLFREVKVLANIRHRNLVSLYGFCANIEMNALLMEYVPNGTLSTHLHPGPRTGMRKCGLDLATRLEIAVGVADALSYLHHECRVPVIHRDLKPANILLDDDFSPKVSDFGISKHVQPGADAVTATCLLGTIGYIPPEYATTDMVSKEGDVYSYGIILLELLTGKRPTDETFTNGYALVSWVSEVSADRIEHVLDSALVDELPAHEEQLQMLLQVGLICTREAPRSRPSMRDVQGMLSQVRGRDVDGCTLSAYPSLETLAKQPNAKLGHAQWHEAAKRPRPPLDACASRSHDHHMYSSGDGDTY